MTQPHQAPSLDSFFAGGGGKSISWKNLPEGTVFGGTILAIHPATIATDPATGEPKTKRDGSPSYQVRIDLQTSQRDPQDPQDDGRRGLYVSGWMTGAVGDAVRAVGGQGGPQVGGQLFVRLIERTPNDRPGLAPINKYDASYVAPTGAEFMFNQQQQPSAPQAPTPPQQGFSQQAPAGAQQGFPQQTPPQAPQGFPQQPAAAGPGFPPVQPQYQPPVPSMTPGAGYSVPPGTPVQQPAPQPPAQPPAPQQQQTLTPEQVAAQMGGQVIDQQPAPGANEPQRPQQISPQAWEQMDSATRQNVAKTFANVPPF